MSEFINNSQERVKNLKELILKMHKGESVEDTQKELKKALGEIPYGEVIQAEEELIRDGLVQQEEVLKFCDLHSDALKGNLMSKFSKAIPESHPVDVMINENREIEKVIENIRKLYPGNKNEKSVKEILNDINKEFNLLMDIEKHYSRKENLIFPFLEKHNITGPPMVMWGKHDETRGMLRSAFSAFVEKENADLETLNGFIELLFEPALKSIDEMIFKEENILFPMCIDTFTDIEWYEIDRQSDEIGFCIYYPEQRWNPEFDMNNDHIEKEKSKFKLSTGSLSPEELEGIFNSLPLDLTFVDKEDKVRYFSHGIDRIFQRSKAILGREVQYCHPPSSVHIVNQILDDFKSGKQNAAKFWINFHGKYVHISYYAVRDIEGNYLGTVELTQGIDEFRELEGERRILQYDN
ncbi:MAG: DUF438 domain-containing protein [Melioribacteraceae bacterium]|nr:DUF438 domain-containing protein [Melioribacteraceae bacterium]